jgi:GH25 family lysozyme M1 (1,4-beta-N-acetylmuramidase)
MSHDPFPIHPTRRGRSVKAVLALVVGVLAMVATALPASALLTGVDVASFQHPGGAPIDWAAVRASGQTFAFIKATEGSGYTNPYFASDWANSGAAGLYRGAYHYARPALPLSTAVDQARWFVSRTGSMTGSADLGGVLDLEETGGLGQADLANWTRTWLGEVQRLTGKAPIVYTGYYFWRDSVGNPADIGASYRLWLPSYPADPASTTFKPLVPGGWGTWTFWQYTSTGSVPGISGNVDMNRFCCDGPSLVALGGGGGSAGSPFGSLDAVSTGYGGVQVSGWAIDPDTTAPIQVHVYAGAAPTALDAGQPRPDVGAAYTGFGSNHGFSGFVASGTGPQQVCAYGINVGGGGNRLIGCVTVNVPTGNPIGSLDLAQGGRGGIDVAGWAIDPNTAASIPVHVYVDGGFAAALTANGPRADVGAFFPGYGAAHGFGTRIAVGPGNHVVCAYGIDVAAPGSNNLLGCRYTTVPDGSPVGSIDYAATAFGLVRVAGWAIDPDTAASIPVHVYVNGVGTAVTADLDRPDVGAVFPSYGSNHGYDVIVPRQGAGPNLVCTYGIESAGTGGNRLLGCQVM